MGLGIAVYGLRLSRSVGENEIRLYNIFKTHCKRRLAESGDLAVLVRA